MKKQLVTFLLSLTTVGAFAQNVGIGTTQFTPSADAILELRSTSSGILIPRMTAAQRSAIINPSTGLLVYQTDGQAGFKYYDGSTWTNISGQGDNLGDHTATENLQLNGQWLSNDGDDEGLIIDENGNIGIGTETPSEKIQIEGNILFGKDADRVISVGGGVTNGESGRDLTLKAGDSHNAGNSAGDGGNIILQAGVQRDGSLNNAEGGNIELRAGLNNWSGGALDTDEAEIRFFTSGSQRMKIQSDGRVGIGTSNPTKELDVNGDVRIRGLAGQGTKLLRIDNNGNITTQSSGSVDNLGDHSAVTTLQMNNNQITGVHTLWTKNLSDHSDNQVDVNDNLNVNGQVRFNTAFADGNVDMNNKQITNVNTVHTKNLQDQTDNQVDVNDNLNVNGQVRFNAAFADGDVQMNNKHIRNTNTIHTKNIQDQTDNQVDVNDNLNVNGQVRFNTAFADGDVQMNNKHIRNTNTIHTKNIQDQTDNQVDVNDNLNVNGQVRFNTMFADGNINMNNKQITNVNTIHTKNLQDQTDNQVDVNDNLNVNGQIRFNTAFADGNVNMNNKQITNVNHIYTKNISDQTDGEVDVLDDFDMNAKDIRNIDVAFFNGNSGGIEYLGSNKIGIDYTIVPRSSSNMDLGRNASGENWDDVVANDFVSFSDSRLKTDIQELEYGLEELMQIKTYSYRYKEEANAQVRMGVMAQEVQEILPETVVSTNTEQDEKGNWVTTENEYLGVTYDQFIPVLIKAVQQQQEQIDELKRQNAQLLQNRK